MEKERERRGILECEKGENDALNFFRIALNPHRPFYSQPQHSPGHPRRSTSMEKLRTIAALCPQLVLVIVYELGSLFAFLMCT